MRRTRDDQSALHAGLTRLFYRLVNLGNRAPIPAHAGDFRLMDRRVVQALQALPERNRFMKGLFAWVGFNSVGVPYERPQRAAGSTKFNLWRLWNFALDGGAVHLTGPAESTVEDSSFVSNHTDADGFGGARRFFFERAKSKSGSSIISLLQASFFQR